mgnify:CR=1 FL=1
MPIYEYEHKANACARGKRFELSQAMSDDALKTCPDCGEPVERMISRVFVSTPKTNSELKSMGFTKLVRRDEGVYENVTALEGESKVMEAGKPETLPNIKKRIRD